MTKLIVARELWTVPGLLTLSRGVLAVVFPLVLRWPVLALVVVAAAALSDFVDGWYARRHNQCSVTGAVLDPITDKLFALSVVVSLVVSGKLPLSYAVLLHTRELCELPLLIWLTLSHQARALRSQHLGSNWPGKVTTALQFGGLLVALLEWHGLAGWVGATAGAGAIAAVAYWLKFRRALRAATDSKPPASTAANA